MNRSWRDRHLKVQKSVNLLVFQDVFWALIDGTDAAVLGDIESTVDRGVYRGTGAVAYTSAYWAVDRYMSRIVLAGGGR